MTILPVVNSPFTGTHVLELVATGAPLADSLDALCREIDELSGLMSAISLLDTDGKRLSRIAGPRLPEALRAATEVVDATPSTTTCGAAVHRREQVIVTEAASSPLFADFRDAIRESGIGAVWSTPFFSKDGRVLGTFIVFDYQSREPSDANLQLVQRATHLASIAVERHLTEKALRESEVRFSTAFYSSPACMTITRLADGRFLYVNDKFVRMFGYSRAEAVGQTAIGLGLHADPAQRPGLMRMVAEGAAQDVEIQGRTRSGETLDLIISMERIEIMGETCILATASNITDRKHAEEGLRQSERLLRVVLDALPVGVAVVNLSGDIILSNPASQRIWSRSILSGPERYVESKAWWHATGQRLSPSEWASVRALVNGETSVNEVLDIEALDGVRKVIQNSAVPIRDTNDRITGAVVVNEDISARKTAERELNDSYDQMRTLTGRLMRAQDDERRRIAQMLHETTAQDLAALKMHLARLDRTSTAISHADRAVLKESIALADQSMTGIRTLSYLLHPPFLDEAGLLSALRWYATGFAERSGVTVELDLPSAFDRLPQDVETTLFRVVQEALINVHRHADSRIAYVRLTKDVHRLVLEIADRGRGLAEGVGARSMSAGQGAGVGVGIAGMRERLKQLGGTLEIESSSRGTTVRALVPLESDTS